MMPTVSVPRARIFTNSRVWQPNPGTPINWEHRVAQGLVGCWLAGHGGNMAYDLSGHRNHGTFVANTRLVPGKFGSAWDFPASGDYIDCGEFDAIEGVNAFSVSLWISLNTANTQYIVSKYGPGGDTFRTYYVGNDVLFYVYASGGTGACQVQNSFMDDSWHHVVCIYDYGAVKMYVNAGVPGTGSTSGTTLVTLNNLFIADDSSSADLQIDTVCVYDRALTVSEVHQLYRDPFCMFF